MLEELSQLLSPPSDPQAIGTPDQWAWVEKILKVTLPDDYKQFIDIYGAGSIGGFLYIFSPFTSDMNFNFIRQQDRWVDLEEIYMPFGTTPNGNILFWKKQGNPNEWTIYSFIPRGDYMDEYPYILTKFLVQLLKGNIQGETIESSQLDLSKGFDNSFFKK